MYSRHISNFLNRELFNGLNYFSFLVIFCIVIFWTNSAKAETFYLDGNLGANCSGNYSIANRACTGSDGNAYNTLTGAVGVLSGGDTLYVRAGTYYRTTGSTWTGALHIGGMSGTSETHTIVMAYNNELAIIGTASDKLNFTSNPGGGWSYYANPAIVITDSSYVDLIGLKTFGQVLVMGGGTTAHDITVQNCDLGGGGPYLNQGWVVLLHTVYNVIVKNCYIHHSCVGDGGGVGSGIGGYAFQAIIENNEFYDNYGEDVAVKDTNGRSGLTIEVRYNFFGPSTTFPDAGNGYVGLNQSTDISYINVHHNIFYHKASGAYTKYTAAISTTFYNNTFIDCVTDINGVWIAPNGPLNYYNNLSYQTSSNHYFLENYNSSYTLSLLNMDYNLYYSANGGTKWTSPGATNQTTLAGWKSASSKDAASVSTNPGLVNVSGSTAEDFKRTSYPNDVAAGSPYGRVCGAYVSGNEAIGVSSQLQLDILAPSIPLSLNVR